MSEAVHVIPRDDASGRSALVNALVEFRAGRAERLEVGQ